tara:strand:+ start:3718 stop:4437 length:720 start_codon:yes stop_codon:yes gene_type:complete
MKQIIKISGMTCEGCVTSVTEKLSSLDEVQSLNIDLASGNTELEVLEILTLDKISWVLPSKYVPTLDSKNNEKKVLKATPSKLKQLFPLFLIFTYLIAGALLLQKNNLQITGFMLDFMGLFFMIFSFFKFLDYKGFPIAFAQYDPLAKRSVLYSKIYPFLESVLGIMFLIRWSLNTALVITIIILSITTVGVIFSLFDKSKINCACLGTALKLPMTKATLIENFIMLVMSLTMIFYRMG